MKQDNPQKLTAQENRTLTGIKLCRSGGTVYGEDFLISTVPGTILFLSFFDDECNEITAENLPLSAEEWAEIAAAVGELTLVEDIPPKPSLLERLQEKLHGKPEILDGGCSTTLRLEWERDGSCKEIKYLWRQGEAYSRLWELMLRLAREKAALLPPEG